jgi:hypothetical protein
MAFYDKPTEDLPTFSSNDFLSSSNDNLTVSMANSLYARLANSNIMTGLLNNFNNAISVDNINLSNAGSVQSNIFLAVNLVNAITTGYDNISIGSQSLKSLSTGYQNIALGAYAGYNFINDAYDNISIGANANSAFAITPSNTIGSVAVGGSANSNDNYSTALGTFSSANFL